jgi:Raf kinase inhibitor-like YbhB/YbcL family protein
MPLSVTSPAFADGKPIPTVHTRDGDNSFPGLKWTGAPEATQSYALVVADPDAPGGTFYHAAFANIPWNWTALPAGVEAAPEGESLRYGTNSFGNARYDGPEPPHGHGVHHYHFRLSALDVPTLSVPAEASVEEVMAEARKHEIEAAEVVGTYER